MYQWRNNVQALFGMGMEIKGGCGGDVRSRGHAGIAHRDLQSHWGGGGGRVLSEKGRCSGEGCGRRGSSAQFQVEVSHQGCMAQAL